MTEQVIEAMHVPLDQIKVGRRVRQKFSNMEKLERSIKDLGLLSPIVVDKRDDGTFLLVAGERRLKACQGLGYKMILATLRENLPELARREIELEENLQREPFTWVEEVNGKRELHDVKKALYGKAKAGARTDLGKDKSGWGIRDTATAMDQSEGTISQDIQLAEALEHFPELAKESNKTAALKKLRQLKKRAGAILAMRKAQKAGVLPNLHKIDCFKFMKKTETETFDLIIADPPWGIDLDETFSMGSSARETREGDGKRMSFEDSKAHAVNLIERLIPECARVLKENRHMFLFCGTQLLSDCQRIASDCFSWVDPLAIIWDKEAIGKPRPYSFAPQYELILHFMKGTRRPEIVKGNVLRYHRVKSGSKIHPTQKPVALLRSLIEPFTAPGEVVFDPMMGSGSSIVAALQCSRSGVGCEMDKKFYVLATARISKEMEE